MGGTLVYIYVGVVALVVCKVLISVMKCMYCGRCSIYGCVYVFCVHINLRVIYIYIYI